MVGVIIGSGVGSLQATETNEKKLMEKVLQEWIRFLFRR